MHLKYILYRSQRKDLFGFERTIFWPFSGRALSAGEIVHFRQNQTRPFQSRAVKWFYLLIHSWNAGISNNMTLNISCSANEYFVIKNTEKVLLSGKARSLPRSLLTIQERASYSETSFNHVWGGISMWCHACFCLCCTYVHTMCSQLLGPIWSTSRTHKSAFRVYLIEYEKDTSYSTLTPVKKRDSFFQLHSIRVQGLWILKK